jgi:hypothetical protein
MLQGASCLQKNSRGWYLDRGGLHAITRLTWPCAVMTLTGQGRVRATKSMRF